MSNTEGRIIAGRTSRDFKILPNPSVFFEILVLYYHLRLLAHALA